MQAEQQLAAAMRGITISREYGSGGGEIARRLAERLGWQLIDHEMVVRIAHELQISEDEAESYDEHTDGALDQLLSHFRFLDGAVPAPVGNDAPITLFDTHSYQDALRHVVVAAAQAGHVVIVGRGAQGLLQEHRDVLNVRVVAPLEVRIRYVMERERLDSVAAQARIQSKDRDRHRTVQAMLRVDSTDAHLYDLVVNTGIVSIDGVVDLVLLALTQKAQQLNRDSESLGPGAGLAPYTTAPGDLHPDQTSTS